MQDLHDALVAAGHTNVPPVEDDPEYGRVLILPPYEDQPAGIIRCEEFEGELSWRWYDEHAPAWTTDPIAFVDELDIAVSRLGVVLNHRAETRGSRSAQRPTP